MRAHEQNYGPTGPFTKQLVPPGETVAGGAAAIAAGSPGLSSFHGPGVEGTRSLALWPGANTAG